MHNKESKQAKTNQASVVEVDSTPDEDQDQKLFNLIQVSTISLSKTRAQ